MIVEVTQFMRPNGRQVQHNLEIDDNCKESYDQLTKCGARLTGEQLMSGFVSQCIETKDGDFAMTLTNGRDLSKNKNLKTKRL